jgi:glyceraldehyde-3-phosphate dehydrogenase/erythrose-4-phosphate dehydrogenase
MTRRNVHVVGTGTIGEPLIGLLCRFQKEFGIDEVTFHKRTPIAREKAKVEALIRRGAKLAVDADVRADFEALGHRPVYNNDEAMARATVVIDCTPAGNANKERIYQHVDGPRGFIAQGSEFGFGKMYARGINDESLVPGDDRYLQVVSCNTHNLTRVVKCITGNDRGGLDLENGRFLLMRRANDISQDESFIPSPQVGGHSDDRFGTHHARDAWHLLQTLGHDAEIFSSAVKLNSQYMHQMHFALQMNRDITVEEVQARMRADDWIAMTERKSANSIFSFGRDHGFYGRILNQSVVPTSTLMVRNKREVIGFCFTPQDGNSLVSSVAAALWFLYPDAVQQRLDAILPYMFNEI